MWDAHNRVLGEMRQFDIGGGTSVLCGAGLKVRDVLPGGKTAMVRINNVPLTECYPETRLCERVLLGVRQHVVSVLTAKQANSDKMCVTLVCTGSAAADTVVQYLKSNGSNLSTRFTQTSHLLATTDGDPRVSPDTTVRRRVEQCVRFTWSASGTFKLPAIVTGRNMKVISSGFLYKSKPKRYYADVTLASCPAVPTASELGNGDNLQCHGEITLLTITMPVDAGSALGKDVQRCLTAEVGLPEDKAAVGVDYSRKNCVMITVGLPSTDRIDELREFSEKEVTCVARKVSAVASGCANIVQRMAGPTATKRLAALVSNRNGVGNDSVSAWGRYCRMSGAIFVYGGTLSSKRLLENVATLEEGLGAMQIVDKPVELSALTPAEAIYTAHIGSGVTLIEHEVSDMKKSYYVSGSKRQVETFEEALKNKGHFFKEADETRLKKLQSSGAKSQCSCCLEPVSKLNLGLAPVLCEHLLCTECLQGALPALRRGDLKCALCPATTAQPLLLCDLPVGALSREDFDSLVGAALENFIKFNPHRKLMKCPMTGCFEVQHEDNLLRDGT